MPEYYSVGQATCGEGAKLVLPQPAGKGLLHGPRTSAACTNYPRDVVGRPSHNDNGLMA